MFGLCVEQPAISPANAVRPQCLFQIIGLEQHRQAGDCAFSNRGGRQRGQRRPDIFLGLGRYGHTLAAKDGGDPVGRPGALVGIVNAGERLERDGRLIAVRQSAAQVMPIAAHGKRCGPDRAAEVERKDLSIGITAELQSHEGEQHGLARAGRADDEGVADIADVKGKPERGRAFGLAEEQRGRAEMLVPFRPCPHGR